MLSVAGSGEVTSELEELLLEYQFIQAGFQRYLEKKRHVFPRSPLPGLSARMGWVLRAWWGMAC